MLKSKVFVEEIRVVSRCRTCVFSFFNRHQRLCCNGLAGGHIQLFFSGGEGGLLAFKHDGMYRSSTGRIVKTMSKRPAIRHRPPFPLTTMTKRPTTQRPLMNRCRSILTKRSRNRVPTSRSAITAAAAAAVHEFT